MLKTETNTSDMERRILAAFEASALAYSSKRRQRYSADFEHGQWWITDWRTGAQWSVLDTSGGRSFNGFDFEQVTQGDED